MKLDPIFKQYLDRGFHLFPVSGSNKKPVFEDNLTRASNDMAQLEAWAKEYKNCGWALSCAKSGFVAVDIDHNHSGMEYWADLILEHGEPETLRQVSGSGGLHYLFNADDFYKYKGKMRPGIDIKFNGYIILYPTVHKSGGQYTWEPSFDREITDMPEWLVELCKKPLNLGTKKEGQTSFTETYLRQLVELCQEFEFDYEEWFKIGMAIHSVDSTSSGLHLWKQATRNASYKEGDEDLCDAKWDSFDQDEEDGVSQSTLTYILKAKGAILPNPELEQDLKAFTESTEAQITRQKRDSAHGFIEENGRFITFSRQVCMDKADDMGLNFYTSGGNAPVVFLRRSGRGGLTANTMTTKALREKTAPYFLKYRSVSPSGIVSYKYLPMADVWLTSTKRKEIDHIVFEPNPGKRSLSTWSEPPLKPKKVTKLIDEFIEIVIRQSICNDNERHVQELLGTLAFIVQRPTEKTSKVLTIYGDQGTGKGLLCIGVMSEILGDLHLTINNPRMLTDRFNGPLANRKLIVCDELVAGENRVFNNIIKNFSGNYELQIEEKFGASYRIRNLATAIVLSNSENAVMIEASNRRFYPIHTSERFAGKTKIFDPFWVALRAGKLAPQFFQYLLDYDLTDWNPNELPKDNVDGSFAKLQTAGVEAEFWHHVFQEEPIEMFRTKSPDEPKEWLDRNLVFDAFLEFADKSKYKGPLMTSDRFWRTSKKLMRSLNGHGIKRRQWIWDNKYFMYSTPDELMREFYTALNLPAPDDFDPLFYLIQEDFDTKELQ